MTIGLGSYASLLTDTCHLQSCYSHQFKGCQPLNSGKGVTERGGTEWKSPHKQYESQGVDRRGGQPKYQGILQTVF